MSKPDFEFRKIFQYVDLSHRSAIKKKRYIIISRMSLVFLHDISVINIYLIIRIKRCSVTAIKTTIHDRSNEVNVGSCKLSNELQQWVKSILSIWLYRDPT